MVWWRKHGVNKVIITMVYADFLFITASGFVSPILAVFLTSQIRGGSLSVVGFAVTIFWLVKSVAQIPVSWYVDRKRGERDDYVFMVIGSAVCSAIPLLYALFAKEIWHVYLLETVNGIGHAMIVPPWFATFTRHIDKHREGTEWMLHSNAVGLGLAAAAAIGGMIADTFGFKIVFLMASAVMFLGTIALVFIRGGLDGGGKKDDRQSELENERIRQLAAR